MHNDERYQRLMQLLERDITSMLEKYNSRIRGHDAIDLDLGRGLVVYLKSGKALWSARTDLIGSYMRDVTLWRWWWYGSDRPVTRSPLNAAFASGQTHGVKILTSPQPIVRSEREAVLLANVCATLSKADGVHLQQSGDRMTFYALYSTKDSGPERVAPNRPSAPTEGDSAVVYHDSLLPAHEPLPPVGSTRQPIMSIAPPSFGPLPDVHPPPMRVIESTAPPAPSPPVVREPERSLVMPLAKLALASVVTHLPTGFQQALITLDLQVQEGGKARFYVVVVATDLEGNLIAVPTPQGLMEAARDLIAEDARQGNGRWRRMTARMKNKPTGISVRVNVHA